MPTERVGVAFPFWEELPPWSNGVGLLDGDHNSSVTIRRCRYSKWQLNFFRCFQIHTHFAMATKVFSIAQKGMGEKA